MGGWDWLTVGLTEGKCGLAFFFLACRNRDIICAPAVEARRSKHQTTREVPMVWLLYWRAPNFHLFRTFLLCWSHSPGKIHPVSCLQDKVLAANIPGADEKWREPRGCQPSINSSLFSSILSTLPKHVWWLRDPLFKTKQTSSPLLGWG